MELFLHFLNKLSEQLSEFPMLDHPPSFIHAAYVFFIGKLYAFFAENQLFLNGKRVRGKDC